MKRLTVLPALTLLAGFLAATPALSQDLGGTLKKIKDSGAVSYTHLRAHETVLDLVCRLLLEKKKQKTQQKKKNTTEKKQKTNINYTQSNK